MKSDTCAEYIKLILRRGGRWRNIGIERTILNDYGVEFQNDTISGYLSFLMKTGRVMSAPVKSGKEKTCFEYWWIDTDANKRKAAKKKLITVADLIVKCLTIAETYPYGHPEREKITIQCEKLKKINNGDKTYLKITK